MNMLEKRIRQVLPIVIMLIVIFWQRGIMGESEFSIAGLRRAIKRLAGKKAARASGSSAAAKSGGAK